MELGKLGVWASARTIGPERLGEAAAIVERLGYGTFWLGSSPKVAQLRPILEATDSLVAATGIANIWATDAAEAAADFTALEADFPGRVLVGIGVGHPEATSDYTRPLTAMRRFLDGLDAVPPERRALAALAPRMLEVAKERSLGAIPYFTPPAHTAWARTELGDGPLVAPEVAVVVDGERATAREYAQLYLSLQNYTSNLLRHGFEEADVADGGSDRLLDEVVPHGSAAEIAAVIRRHFDAGADHVAIQALGEPGIPERGWAALAAELR